jgi:hypothetical protein
VSPGDAPAAPDPGSFRDPTGRVWVEPDRPDRVLRALTAEGRADLEALLATRFAAAAVDDGRLVATERLDPAPDVPGGPWAAVVAHPRVPVVSYPYEWSFSALRDATLLQLDLLVAALGEGLVTKDASPYNVQLVGTRPLLVDVGSFEPLAAGEPWRGYRQACALGLYPLLLQAVVGVPFQPWLRGSLEGIAPADMARLLRGRHRLRRGVPTHVWLHARAESRFARRTGADTARDLRRAGVRPEVLAALANGLRRRVAALEWSAGASAWSDYAGRGHYTDADLAAKEGFVAEVAGARHRRTVWDVGANDGRFSRLVAPHADAVVASDADPLVVDRLHRALRAEGDEVITPLVHDLADPSPGLGWRGRERPPLEQRVAPDLVLHLAVIHHVVISRTVPVDAYVDALAALDAEVVLEVPHRDDPKVVGLLAAKQHPERVAYGLDVVEAAVAPRFDVARRLALPSGTRTLLQLRHRR